MKNNKFKNVFYYYGGAIGGLTLGIHFLEGVRKNVGNGSNYFILVPKIIGSYNDILEAYPDIKIIELNKRKFFKALLIIISKSFQRNLFITAPAFGETNNQIKILGWILTRFGGFLAGFEGSTKKLTFLYTKIFERKLKNSVFKSVNGVLGFFNFKFDKIPSLKYIEDSNTKEKFKKYGEYIVIHPFPANPKRSLPYDRWNNIVKTLSTDLSSLNIILTGAKKDLRYSKIVLENNNSDNLIDLVNKTNLKELIHLIDNSKLFIGVDTGITHLAALLDKKVVEVGNLSNPPWLATYNPKSTVLFNYKNCMCNGDKSGICEYEIGGQKYFKCMIDVSDKNVIETVKEKLLNG